MSPWKFPTGVTRAHVDLLKKYGFDVTGNPVDAADAEADRVAAAAAETAKAEEKALAADRKAGWVAVPPERNPFRIRRQVAGVLRALRRRGLRARRFPGALRDRMLEGCVYVVSGPGAWELLEGRREVSTSVGGLRGDPARVPSLRTSVALLDEVRGQAVLLRADGGKGVRFRAW